MKKDNRATIGVFQVFTKVCKADGEEEFRNKFRRDLTFDELSTLKAMFGRYDSIHSPKSNLIGFV